MKSFFEQAALQQHPLRVLEDFLEREESNEKAKKYDDLRFVGYVLEIGYDTVTIITSDPFKITVGGEVGRLDKKYDSNNITFHIFIDKSVIEVFINYQECITSRIYFTSKKSNGFSIYIKQGLINLKKLDIWNLKTIW